MSILRVAALAAAIGLNLSANPSVTVCLQGLSVVPGPVLNQAQILAKDMLARASVDICWRRGAPPGGHQSVRVIVVDLADETPRRVNPGALAVSLPYEGTHITVFYDRVRQTPAAPSLIPTLLAHVFVHEITHLLEGSDQHAASGIMKARWTPRDYSDMAEKPLLFSETDLLLIRSGMASTPGP